MEERPILLKAQWAALPPPLSHSPRPVPNRRQISSSTGGIHGPDRPPPSPMARPSSHCLSEGLAAASRAPELLGLGRAGGGCFSHLLLPLPSAPSSSTTGRTGFRAECAGPMDLALPGRGLKRTISTKTSLDTLTPYSRRAWPGRGHGVRKQPGPGSPRTALPHPAEPSQANSPDLAARALPSPPLRKGVTLAF